MTDPNKGLQDIGEVYLEQITSVKLYDSKFGSQSSTGTVTFQRATVTDDPIDGWQKKGDPFVWGQTLSQPLGTVTKGTDVTNAGILYKITGGAITLLEKTQCDSDDVPNPPKLTPPIPPIHIGTAHTSGLSASWTGTGTQTVIATGVTTPATFMGSVKLDKDVEWWSLPTTE